MTRGIGRQPSAHRHALTTALAASLTALFAAFAAMASLSCLVLAGFSLVQWFSWPDARWAHLGWFTYGVLMSAAPWMTQNRGNGWAMICMTAMGAGALGFALQRLGATGPLACKGTDVLCRIAEGVRLSLGEHALVALFGLGGLGLVMGGLRYAFWDRPRD